MRDQQVVPAVAKDHDRRFGVDGDVERLSFGIQPLAGLRIELDQPDIAEVRAVGEPERSVGGSRKTPGSIALLSSRRRTRRTGRDPPTCSPANGIERLADEQPDRGLRLGAGGRVVDEVLSPDLDYVEAPEVLLPPRASTSVPRPPARHWPWITRRAAARSSRSARTPTSAGRHRWHRREPPGPAPRRSRVCASPGARLAPGPARTRRHQPPRQRCSPP